MFKFDENIRVAMLPTLSLLVAPQFVAGAPVTTKLALW